MPCIVDRLEGFVMLWKKNGEIITVASQIIDKVTMIMIIIMITTMMLMTTTGNDGNHHDNYGDNDAGGKDVRMTQRKFSFLRQQKVL